LIFENLFCSL